MIGAGAAGIFAAVNCAALYPQHRIIVFEKSDKLLSKVRVSGGGRCNVTHACFDTNILVKNYPRGEKQLKSCFSRFNAQHTINWFEERGVKLKTEADGRMFPITDNSQTIIDCLLSEAAKHNVNIETKADVTNIQITQEEKVELTFQSGTKLLFDSVLIATGGSPSAKSYEWLHELGHEIVSPVPSLFTFNIPSSPIAQLMGIAVEQARIKIMETNFSEEGALLITHWGMSGPAVLKLSSRAARALAELNYDFTIQIKWLPLVKEDELRNELLECKRNTSWKFISTHNSFSLPKRLWEYLSAKAGIRDVQQWAELSKEQLNKLLNALLYDEYYIKGKTTFKEEFVTCGGVALTDVDFKTMQSKKMLRLYFAGEVLDIDAVTGGFNFQAAWTTGFIAAEAMGKNT